jgi:hypothetical protein
MEDTERGELLRRVAHAEAQNTILKGTLALMAEREGLAEDVRRMTDALAVLAGRVQAPMGAQMTETFAANALDGGPPAPRTRKWLIDSIVEAVREIIDDREALRQVLWSMTTGTIGRRGEGPKIVWWHMHGFIRGESLVDVLRQLHGGIDPEDQPRVAQQIASVETMMKEHK